MSVPISNLPIPNLDDRRFDDLMKEARSLIINYDRDWTNHNPSDPGITLLELFAWLSEMVMYRMNQVTTESYANFLKLIAGTQNKDDLEKILESTYLFDWNNFKPDGEIRLRNFLKTELGLDWVTNYNNAKIIKYDQSYFFYWNDVPGNDDKILTSFLKMRFGIDWVEKSIIVKNYDDETYDETIKLSSGDKFVSLGLKKEEKKVSLITDDGRTDEFVLMEEEDKLNIYNPSIKTLNISSGKKWIEIKVDEIEGKGYLKVNGCKVRYLHAIKENGGLNIYNMPDLDGAYKNLLNFLVEINDGKKKSISEIKQAPVEFMESMYRAITSEDYEKRAQDCMKILLQKDPPGRAVCMTNRKLLYSKGIEEYGVNEELPGHVSVIIIPRGVEDSYLFRWDEIPGNDNGKLVEFLEQKYGIDWAKTAKIEKIDSGGTINVSTEEKTISLKLNDKKTFVNLKIDDGCTFVLNAMTENSILNIYEISRYCKEEGKPSDLLLEEIKAYLDARRLITTRVHVVSPVYANVKLRVQLAIKENIKQAEVISEAERRIKEYFNPISGGPEGTGWPLGRHIYRSEVYNLLESINGVDYVAKIWINDVENASALAIEEHQLIALEKFNIETVKYE